MRDGAEGTGLMLLSHLMFFPQTPTHFSHEMLQEVAPGVDLFLFLWREELLPPDPVRSHVGRQVRKTNTEDNVVVKNESH